MVDSGLARVPRYEPDVGLTRLETVRVSRAAADQRRGRAGRTEPGVCYRLWDEPQTASLEAYARPEILSSDLSSFVLDLAAWGAAPEALAFLDPPPKGALAEARALLAELGALDGRPHHRGRPRAAPPAAAAAACPHGGRCGARRRGRARRRHRGGADRARARRRRRRPDASRGEFPPRPLAPRRATRARWRSAGATLAQQTPAAPSRARAGEGGGWGVRSARSLSLAYPDRIAKNRGTGSFTLANGRGGNVDAASPLSREPFIAVAELTGSAAQGRIVLAAPITLAEIEARFADRIESRDEVTFDEQVDELARAARHARSAPSRSPSRPGRSSRATRPRACSPKASRASGSASCRGPRR